MMLLAFGANIILLVATWHILLRPTILDHYRDALFDLRDEIREHFLAYGQDLDSQIYQNLRDLLNGYLRFTESFRLAEFIWFERKILSNDRLRHTIALKMRHDLASGNETQSRYVTEVRYRAVSVMQRYMLMTSGPMVLIFVFILPFIALHIFVGHLLAGSSLRIFRRAIATPISALKEQSDQVFSIWKEAVSKVALKRDVVEAGAYSESELV